MPPRAKKAKVTGEEFAAGGSAPTTPVAKPTPARRGARRSIAPEVVAAAPVSEAVITPTPIVVDEPTAISQESNVTAATATTIATEATTSPAPTTTAPETGATATAAAGEDEDDEEGDEDEIPVPPRSEMSWGERILTYPSIIMVPGSRSRVYQAIFDEFCAKPRVFWKEGWPEPESPGIKQNKFKPAINRCGFDYDQIFFVWAYNHGKEEYVDEESFIHLCTLIWNYEQDRVDFENADYQSGLATKEKDQKDKKRKKLTASQLHKIHPGAGIWPSPRFDDFSDDHNHAAAAPKVTQKSTTAVTTTTASTTAATAASTAGSRPSQAVGTNLDSAILVDEIRDTTTVTNPPSNTLQLGPDAPLVPDQLNETVTLTQVLKIAQHMSVNKLSEITIKEMIQAVNGDEGPDGWKKGVTQTELTASLEPPTAPPSKPAAAANGRKAPARGRRTSAAI